MKIRVTVSNDIPTKHQNRILHPKIEVEDDAMLGETPQQLYRRLSIIGNTLFAREVVEQEVLADRQVQVGNAAWAHEYLSSVSDDHPVNAPIKK